MKIPKPYPYPCPLRSRRGSIQDGGLEEQNRTGYFFLLYRNSAVKRVRR
jgi:hypothetical protein